jgi:hypothetical protein
MAKPQKTPLAKAVALSASKKSPLEKLLGKAPLAAAQKAIKGKGGKK